jgi:hypothetical protein
MWTLIVVAATVAMYNDSQRITSLLMLLAISPALIFTRIKKVSFDREFIYVSEGRRETAYEISRLKAINESDLGRFDPWFELEIRRPATEVIKIDFLPRVMDDLRFRFWGEYTGRLLELRQLRLSVKSRGDSN